MIKLITLADRLNHCAESIGGKRTLALATDISEAQLFRYLRGESEPSASKLIIIANACHVDAGWLLTGHGDPSSGKKSCLTHEPAFYKTVLQTFDEAVEEIGIDIPIALKPEILELIYLDYLMERDRGEYAFELNHLAMLFKIYFLLEFKSDTLNHYRKFIEQDFNGENNKSNLVLEPLTNQICRANTAIYNSPASQFYFDKMGRSVWPQAAKRLDETIEEAWQILGHKPLKWLDLGCGNGREISYIHRHYENISVTGVDNAQYCMDLCKEYVASDWLPEDAFVKADLRFLPFKAETFDVAYSRQTLEFFPYFEESELGVIQVFQQAHKVLKPGGLFLAVARYGHYKEYARFQELYNNEKMIQIAQKTGFKILDLKPWSYSKNATKAEEYQPNKFDEWIKISFQKK